MAVLLVTHNFGVVADLCDRVSVMKDNRIVETGPVRAIFADPQHAHTQSSQRDARRGRISNNGTSFSYMY